MRGSTTLLGVAILGSLLCGAPAARAAAPAGGPIRVFATPNGNGATGTVVITGAIGDFGTTTTIDQNGKVDPNGHYVRIVLKKGTFLVDSTRLDAAANSAQPTLNMATCSGVFSAHGTVTLSKGTGRYKGIAGTVTIAETFAFVGPTYTSGAKKGQCNMSQDAQPVAQYGAITGSGTVRFG